MILIKITIVIRKQLFLSKLKGQVFARPFMDAKKPRNESGMQKRKEGSDIQQELLCTTI